MAWPWRAADRILRRCGTIGFAITYDRSQFTLWEATLQRRQAANEAERRQILADLLAWLGAHGTEFGIEEALMAEIEAQLARITMIY